MTLAALVAILTSGGGDVRSSVSAPRTEPVERPPAAAGPTLATPGPGPAAPADPAPPARVDRAPASTSAVEEVQEPARVQVDGSGINADVVPVGVADDGQMELPEHPDVVGWYRHGPAPGSGAGSVVLAGHVDSIEHGLGQLARLRQSEIGDEVLVRTATGGRVRYTVASVERTPKADLPVADVFRRDGEEQLVLITCGGEFDASRGSYADNVVVTAVPR